jgi:hypothetical protein
VGNHEGGTPVHQTLHRFQNHTLCLDIDRGRGLVENKDGSVLQERTSERDPLAFAADRRMPRSPTSVS